MKILINQLGRIGDLILITPTIKILKECLPNSEIYFLAGDKNAPALIDNPNLSDIFTYHKNIKGIFKLISNLRKHQFDYYLDPKDHKSTESALLSKIIKAYIKIGCKNPKANFNIDINKIKNDDDIHFTDIALAGVKYILDNEKIYVDIHQTPKPDLYLNKNSNTYFNKFKVDNRIKDFILINISASNSNKMWILENWKSTIKHLLKHHLNDRLSLVICSAPSEKQQANELINEFKNKNIVYYKSNSINDIFSVVAHSKLLFTPDTSLVHIASSFSIPIIALYSGNDIFFDKFKPSFDENTAAKSQIIRANAGDDGIHTITIEQVKNSIENVDFSKL